MRMTCQPGIPKDHHNRIYDNLTEMQPWIYSYKRIPDRSFKKGSDRIFSERTKPSKLRKQRNVNVYLPVLNLNFRDPRSGALKVGLTEWDQSFINMRVWSWLRMNAGGVLNTCKSNEALKSIPSGWSLRWLSGGRVSNAWVTCPIEGDNS